MRRVEQRIATLQDLKVPGDGIIRAVVSRAAKLPLKHPFIVDFRKLLHSYCVLWIGFSSRRVVQLSLHVMLCRMVEDRKRKARIAAEEAIRMHHAHPEACNVHLKMILKPLGRSDVEAMMMDVFRHIHLEILAKAQTGAVVDCEAGRSSFYEPRKAVIGKDSGRTCFFIVKRTLKGIKVITLVTEAEFRRRSRRNWKDRQRRRDRNGTFRRTGRNHQRDVH
jgi:hypothetical protein